MDIIFFWLSSAHSAVARREPIRGAQSIGAAAALRAWRARSSAVAAASARRKVGNIQKYLTKIHYGKKKSKH